VVGFAKKNTKQLVYRNCNVCLHWCCSTHDEIDFLLLETVVLSVNGKIKNHNMVEWVRSTKQLVYWNHCGGVCNKNCASNCWFTETVVFVCKIMVYRDGVFVLKKDIVISFSG
jgi:hypothetical protein